MITLLNKICSEMFFHIDIVGILGLIQLDVRIYTILCKFLQLRSCLWLVHTILCIALSLAGTQEHNINEPKKYHHELKLDIRYE